MTIRLRARLGSGGDQAPWFRRCPLWVRNGRCGSSPLTSALPPKADIDQILSLKGDDDRSVEPNAAIFRADPQKRPRRLGQPMWPERGAYDCRYCENHVYARPVPRWTG